MVLPGRAGVRRMDVLIIVGVLFVTERMTVTGVCRAAAGVRFMNMPGFNGHCFMAGVRHRGVPRRVLGHHDREQKDNHPSERGGQARSENVRTHSQQKTIRRFRL